jgi:hypothetical protein
MIPATALLVMLTLTGTPVAALVCLGLCGQPPSQVTCQEKPTTGPGGPSLSGRHTCDTVLPDTTFVIDVGRRVLDAPVRHAATAQPLLSIPALGRGWVERVLVYPAASPPAAGALHVILRI